MEEEGDYDDEQIIGEEIQLKALGDLSEGEDVLFYPLPFIICNHPLFSLTKEKSSKKSISLKSKRVNN